MRSPRTEWVFALYYPQEVTQDMGPTAILPQYHHVDNVSSENAAEAEEVEAPMTCKAGTVALIDFDCWHRGSKNSSDKVRYMCKFHYCRVHQPSGPSWDHCSDEWTIDAASVQPAKMRFPELWQSTWRWLLNSPLAPAAAPASPDPQPALQLLDEVHARGAGGTAEGYSAAYRLAAAALESGSDGVAAVLPPLLAELEVQATAMTEQMTDWVPYSFGPLFSFHLPPAAQALMAIGGEAVVAAMAPLLTADSWTLRVLTAETLGRISRPPQGWAGDTAAALLRGLGDCTQHPHWWVRRSALESAGHLCLQGIAPALPAAVRDEEFLVVRMACLAAAQIAAPAAPELVDGLGALLDGDDRYNRAFATVALQRVEDPDGQARERLLHFLLTSRFDSDGKF